MSADTITSVPADRIRAGNNDREVFDRAELTKLAASIDKLSCLQPPLVRPVGDGYELIYGERRFRAMTDILGWTEVPVKIEDLSDEAASEAMLVENTGRVDLDPVAEAEAYRRRMETFGLDVAGVAAWAGKTTAWVSNRLKLLQLRPEARYLVTTGQMTIGYTGDLVPLDYDRQMLAIKAWVANDCSMNWYQWHSLTVDLLAEQQAQPMFDPDSFFTLEDRVEQSSKAARRAGLATLRQAIGMVVEAFDAGRDLGPVVDVIRELADKPDNPKKTLVGSLL